jgi:glycosyltransferase involved in cell wall biosynthesis
MVKLPVISIALCTYNGERFLEELLESLLAQTYEPLEIVVVDDHSSDDTWAILNRYAEKDSRFRLYRNNENLGYNRNFEKALGLCKGSLKNLL